jgi:hypothetical protein
MAILDSYEVIGPSWLASNMLMMESVISVTNPSNLSEEIFEEWIPRVVRNIESCEFKEAFKKKGELPKVEMKIIYRPDSEIKDIQAKVREFCYNFKPV